MPLLVDDGPRLTSAVLASSGATETTTAPFTGQPVAAMPLSLPEDVTAAYAAARAAQPASNPSALALVWIATRMTCGRSCSTVIDSV
jgi:hypothetical protein